MWRQLYEWTHNPFTTSHWWDIICAQSHFIILSDANFVNAMGDWIILLQCHIGGTLCKVKFHHSFLSVTLSFYNICPIVGCCAQSKVVILFFFYYAGGWVADSISQYIHCPLGRIYYYLMLVLLNYFSDQKSCVLWDSEMTARLSVAHSVPLSTAVVTVVSDSTALFFSILHTPLGEWGSSVGECRTCDQKVPGSCPSRSSRRIFFSRVNFLCWLLSWYLFHPVVFWDSVDYIVVCKAPQYQSHSFWFYCFLDIVYLLQGYFVTLQRRFSICSLIIMAKGVGWNMVLVPNKSHKMLPKLSDCLLSLYWPSWTFIHM